MVVCIDLEEDLIGDIIEDIVVEGINIDGLGSGDGVLIVLYVEFCNVGIVNYGGYYFIQEIIIDEMFIGVKGGDWFDGGDLICLYQYIYMLNYLFINGIWV